MGQNISSDLKAWGCGQRGPKKLCKLTAEEVTHTLTKHDLQELADEWSGRSTHLMDSLHLV
jgi:hypothetical protein